MPPLTLQPKVSALLAATVRDSRTTKHSRAGEEELRVNVKKATYEEQLYITRLLANIFYFFTSKLI